MTADFSEEATPTEQGQRIHLVGGINFSTWPDLKWSRANTHVSALEAKFNEWHASAPVSVEGELRQDRLGIDLVARVPRGIPSHDWALGVGDAIHNFRSAFDAVAWGMAHFDGQEPTNPKSVSFPICNTEKEWKDKVKSWVGEISPELMERLRIVQPYTFAVDGQPTFMHILHELDIQDKHRDILTVSVDLHTLNLDGSFEYEDREAQATPNIEMYSNVKFQDGAVLATLHAGARIRTVGKMIMRPAVKIAIVHRNNTFGVFETLKKFAEETRRYLDILLLGLADTGDSDGWSDLEVSTSPT